MLMKRAVVEVTFPYTSTKPLAAASAAADRIAKAAKKQDGGLLDVVLKPEASDAKASFASVTEALRLVYSALMARDAESVSLLVPVDPARNFRDATSTSSSASAGRPPQSDATAAPALAKPNQEQWWSWRQYDVVCIGGSFDRLHAGHRLLLTAGALSVRPQGLLHVGLTGDMMLTGKRHRELLQPFEERKKATLAFLRKVEPRVKYSVVELRDVGGPANEDPAAEAIVVSLEGKVLESVEKINAIRRGSGFRPLETLSVGLVGTGPDSDEESKISSSRLRDRDAKKKRPKL